MRLFGSDRIAKLMDRMGLEEGEVIQHSMITKSIERAQKKVEENNFAIRKRLLEYDDVMNSQREVIYKRRRNALFGDRLQLDIMNMIYDTCEDLVLNTQDSEDYDGFKLNVLGILALDYPISKEDFLKIDFAVLSEQLYETAYGHYRQKNKAISEKAYPIFQNIQKERGATIDNIIVPFTDRKKQIGVVTNLEQNLETHCNELIISMEKMVTLAFIDQAWKEHLREMDDLKQSVQNAVYEQKDPLLIYKFEAFELFKRFIAKVNEETNTFLMHADLPVQESNEVQEARTPRTRQRLQESKASSESLLSGRSPDTRNRPPAEKTLPVKSTKVAGRNQRVTVQYVDGNIKKDVKFKTVEDDIINNKCVLLED